MMDIYIVHGSMDSSCGFLRSWPSYFCEGSRTRFRVFLSSFPNPSQREAPFFLASLPRFPPTLFGRRGLSAVALPPPNAWAPRHGAVRGRGTRPGGPGPPAPGRRRRPHVAATAYRPGAWGCRPRRERRRRRPPDVRPPCMRRPTTASWRSSACCCSTGRIPGRAPQKEGTGEEEAQQKRNPGPP